MKKFIVLLLYVCNVMSAFSQDWIVSDTVFNFGYLYHKDAPLGFEIGAGGLTLSANLPGSLFNNSGVTGYYEHRKYRYPDPIPEHTVPGFGQISLTYGVKIFTWLRIPLGVSLYATTISYTKGDVVGYSGNTAHDTYTYEIEYRGMGKLDLSHWGFNAGVEFLINPFSASTKISLKAQAVNFKYFFFGAGVSFIDQRSADKRRSYGDHNGNSGATDGGEGGSNRETTRDRDYFSYSAATVRGGSHSH
jgi:hypothetical protein